VGKRNLGQRKRKKSDIDTKSATGAYRYKEIQMQRAVLLQYRGGMIPTSKGHKEKKMKKRFRK
jgi:hypothetical protein